MKFYKKGEYFVLENKIEGQIWEKAKKVKIAPLEENNLETFTIHNLSEFPTRVFELNPLETKKEDGSFYTIDEFLAVISPEDTVAPPPIDYTPLLEEIRDEIKKKNSYNLFEDEDGNVLVGKVDENGILKYYKPDGSEYTGDVKPYSREVQQTITDYCADSVPYSLIQLRDADTKEVIVSIWRNDNDLTESNTAPANKVKGVCVVPPIDYTTLLTSIDSKLNTLEQIKDKLTDANATLTAIKEDTATINIKLDDLIYYTIDVRNQLIDLNTKVLEGNLKLDQIVLKLTNIDTNISSIKTDITAIKDSVASIDLKLDDVILKLLDIVDLIENSNTLLQSLLDELNVSIEIESYEKNNGTINYLQKDTIIWDNETGTQISKTTEYSINGIDWTATAPAGDVNLGFLVPPANTFAQDTFQLTDCEGTPIGVEEEVIKVVQLAKQTAKICNTEDITTPITDAIAQNKTVQKGKKQDLLTWVAVANDELIIPAKFTTMALLAAKGEFTISNETNNFSADLNTTGGTILNKIEISADGVGTESGATDTPNTIDTRSTYDMDTLSNSFLVKCIRDGVLKLELYKI